MNTTPPAHAEIGSFSVNYDGFTGLHISLPFDAPERRYIKQQPYRAFLNGVTLLVSRSNSYLKNFDPTSHLARNVEEHFYQRRISRNVGALEISNNLRTPCTSYFCFTEGMDAGTSAILTEIADKESAALRSADERPDFNLGGLLHIILNTLDEKRQHSFLTQSFSMLCVLEAQQNCFALNQTMAAFMLLRTVQKSHELLEEANKNPYRQSEIDARCQHINTTPLLSVERYRQTVPLSEQRFNTDSN